MKALHLHMRQEALGHLVAKLLRELSPDLAVPEELVERGNVLDNFYIPTRHPNGHPQGVPFEHCGRLQSEEAIWHARAIIELVSYAVA